MWIIWQVIPINWQVLHPLLLVLLFGVSMINNNMLLIYNIIGSIYHLFGQICFVPNNIQSIMLYHIIITSVIISLFFPIFILFDQKVLSSIRYCFYLSLINDQFASNCSQPNQEAIFRHSKTNKPGKRINPNSNSHTAIQSASKPLYLNLSLLFLLTKASIAYGTGRTETHSGGIKDNCCKMSYFRSFINH